MSVKNRGLGRGLDLLLKGSGSDPVDEEMQGATEVALSEIFPNPAQPRQHFSEEGIDDLARSIQAQGVLQPILVRPRKDDQTGYEIVAGERRWRATQRTDRLTIPVLVREIDDKETLAIALIENLQREDLNPIEEAMGLNRIRDELGLSQEELANRVGKSRSAVANSMRLLNLPERVKEDLENKAITPGHARAYLSMDTPEGQNHVHGQVVTKNLNVRQTEVLVRNMIAKKDLEDGQEDGPAKEAAKRFCKQCRSELEGFMGKRKGLSLRVTGGPAKGAITLSYATSRERERILRIMEQGAGRMDEEV
ncbi:ParB/RepB/Spo0J family partition protein [Desulfoplanes sp.]